MTSRISFLSAVLAAGAFAALPALADSTTPAPSSAVQPPAAQVQSSVKAAGTQASTDAHADVNAKKDKLSTEKKKHEQVAEHPGKVMKDAATTGTGTSTTGKSETTKQ